MSDQSVQVLALAFQTHMTFEVGYALSCGECGEGDGLNTAILCMQ